MLRDEGAPCGRSRPCMKSVFALADNQSLHRRGVSDGHPFGGDARPIKDPIACRSGTADADRPTVLMACHMRRPGRQMCSVGRLAREALHAVGTA